MSFMVTLLFGVAQLDRCLLIIWQVLDAPHTAFVAAVKLEQAWRELSDGETVVAAVIGEKEEQQQHEGDGNRRGHGTTTA